MVVVAIIGILAALAAPAFVKMVERNRLKGAAEALYNDLQLARTEAVKRNLDVELQFSSAGPTTNWCWGLRERDPSDPGIDLSVDCDCTVPPANAAATNACKIDGVVRTTRSTDYPDVSLQTNLAGARTEFEPHRGTADVFGKACLELKNDKLQVRVSSLGRVLICTTTGMPGYQPCPSPSPCP
jgi:type IV fimbrial biogenesis protein FimT